MFLFISPSPDLSERKRGEIDRQNEKRGKRKPNKFIKCYYKFYKEIIKNQITFCGALFAATIYNFYYKFYKEIIKNGISFCGALLATIIYKFYYKTYKEIIKKME